MKKIFSLILFTGLLFNCSVKNNNTSGEETKDKEQSSLVSTDSIDNDSTLYIDLINKFYNHDDYYIPLYYRDEYSESAQKAIMDAQTEVIFEDLETKRIKLNPDTVKKYLLIDNLDKLFVFNTNQSITDTLKFKNYEFFDNMIETSFIATYETKLPDKKNIVISSNGLKSEKRNKSPLVKSDSAYIFKVIGENNFKQDHIYSFGHLNYNNDTLAYLSFGNYRKGLECLYLLKNGHPMDSVINDYIITDLTPVPLATENEILYVASLSIPETDISWTSLTGIDLKNYKFKFYDRNRISINGSEHP